MRATLMLMAACGSAEQAPLIESVGASFVDCNAAEIKFLAARHNVQLALLVILPAPPYQACCAGCNRLMTNEPINTLVSTNFRACLCCALPRCSLPTLEPSFSLTCSP